MVAEVIIVIARQQRKDHPTPQLAQLQSHLITELTDTVGQHGVGALLSMNEPQETVGRDEGNPLPAVPVETGDDRDAPSLGMHPSMLGDPDACVGRQRQRQDLAGSDVPDVIRLGCIG